jgi:hypothetical protein
VCFSTLDRDALPGAAIEQGLSIAAEKKMKPFDDDKSTDIARSRG